MLTGKPTGDQVVKYREHLLRVWSDAHSRWEVIDTYINRTFPVWPEQFNDRAHFIPGRGPSILSHAVDNQLAFEPSVHRPPAHDSEQSKERADKIEPFLTAVFSETALLETSLTWKQAGRHMLAYGYTVVTGPLITMKDRPEEPVRKKGESDHMFSARHTIYENKKRTWMPFRIRAPHPSRVLVDPLEKRPTTAIIHSYRYSHELASMFTSRERKAKNDPLREGLELGEYTPKTDPFTKLLTDEVFTQDWHGVYIGGELLFIEPNIPEFVPVGHAFSGFGQEPTQTQDGINPRDLAVGILDPLLETLRVQAQAMSSIHNALVEASFRRRMTRGSAQEILNQEAKGDTIVEVPEGKDSLWWEDIPQLPAWIFETLRMVDQDLEFASFSKQLAGIRETGVTTVGQQAILSTAAARKFVAPQKQLEHIATNIGSNILRLVDVLGEELTVQGHPIRPSDLEHDYSIRIQFELIDPVLQMQERITAMNEHTQRLLSAESYFARTRLEDASGEMRRIDEEDVRNMPEVKMLRVREILKEWGLLEEFDKMQEELAAQEAAQGTPGSSQATTQPLTGSVPGQPRTGGALGAESLNSPI